MYAIRSYYGIGTQLVCPMAMCVEFGHEHPQVAAGAGQWEPLRHLSNQRCASFFMAGM